LSLGPSNKETEMALAVVFLALFVSVALALSVGVLCLIDVAFSLSHRVSACRIVQNRPESQALCGNLVSATMQSSHPRVCGKDSGARGASEVRISTESLTRAAV
jgi:hypothetical protein